MVGPAGAGLACCPGSPEEPQNYQSVGCSCCHELPWGWAASYLVARGTPTSGFEEDQLLDHLHAGHFDLLAAEGLLNSQGWLLWSKAPDRA